MSPTARERDFLEFFGPDIGSFLLRWGKQQKRALFLPATPWKATGFTSAFAASVVIGASTPAEHDRYLVAKVVPDDGGKEAEAHQKAMESGTFAKQRLVRLFGSPIFCPDGHVIFFQDLAGHDQRFRPAALTDVTEAVAVVDLCERIMAGVAAEWNPVARVSTVDLADFVLAELRHPISATASVERWADDLGLSHPDAAWLSTPDDLGPLPNPVLFGVGHPALLGRAVDLLWAHGHGDLHLGNVMVPQGERGIDPSRYQLIDLSTYSARAPRGRDEVTLLLSAIAWLWPTLSQLHRAALLTELTQPRSAAHQRQDPLLVRLVAAAFGSSAHTVEHSNFVEAWHGQYLLVLMSTTLRFTTFENLPTDLRWWLVRVACHAARAYVDLLGVPVPDTATHTLQATFEASGPITSLTPERSAVSWDGLGLGGYRPFAGGAD